jgi:hypothetical protein
MPTLEPSKQPEGPTARDSVQEPVGLWGPDITPEEDARLTHQMKHGPCFECGATSPEDAEGKCKCAGDKDHCHGCDIWPDA